jgi:hypothetical protein
MAGDLAAEHLGQESMLAGDLLQRVPEAIQHVKHGTDVRQFAGSE